MNKRTHFKFEDYYEYGKKQFKTNFRWMNFFAFQDLMVKYFGDEIIESVETVWNRLHQDIGIPELFNYNLDNVIARIEKYDNKVSKLEELENENNRCIVILNKLEIFKDTLNRGFENIIYKDWDEEEYDFEEYLINKSDFKEIKEIVLFTKGKGFGDIPLDAVINVIQNQFSIYFESIKNLSNHIKATPIQHFANNQNQVEEVNKISVVSSITDIVRIFEAMRDAEIISNKRGEESKIGDIFENEKFLDNYFAVKSRLKRDHSSTNSKQLLKFIKILCKKSLSKKDNEIEEIIRYLDKLQNH